MRGLEEMTVRHEHQVIDYLRTIPAAEGGESESIPNLISRIDSYKGAKRIIYLVVVQLYLGSMCFIMQAALSGISMPKADALFDEESTSLDMRHLRDELIDYLGNFSDMECMAQATEKKLADGTSPLY